MHACKGGIHVARYSLCLKLHHDRLSIQALIIYNHHENHDNEQSVLNNTVTVTVEHAYGELLYRK